MRHDPYAIFDDYIGGDFFKCLQALEAIYNGIDRNRIRDFEKAILRILSASEHDLGIEWKDGDFVPTGAKLLDEGLVNDNLKWLQENKHEHIRKPFDKALLHYSESLNHPEKLNDVVTDMYEALEATAKWTLGNNKKLDANKQEFVKTLKLVPEYERMLTEYISYAHKYARHAQDPKSERYKVPPSDAENFIYLTGLFIRFAIQRSINSEK